MFPVLAIMNKKLMSNEVKRIAEGGGLRAIIRK